MSTDSVKNAEPFIQPDAPSSMTQGTDMTEQPLAQIFNAVMVDLETLGTSKTAFIRSIGAYKFDLRKVQEFKNIQTEQLFYQKILASDCDKYGFSTDLDTIQWWAKQSPEAQKEFETGQRPMSEVLTEFIEFIPKNAWVFGNGATFDNVILNSAYEKLGLQYPVSYRNDLCYRTIKSLFKVKPKVKARVKHHALEDAVVQGLHLQEILEVIRSSFRG